MTATAHPGGDPGRGIGGAAEGGRFIRGDADQNGKIELSDAVFTLSFLFLGGEAPLCADAMDANDDGKLIISDAIFTLSALFLGSVVLPAPYPEAGLDPTADLLDCGNTAFARIRREIFARTCASASCHSGALPAGSLDLESPTLYSQLYLAPSAAEAAKSAGILRVKPGFPEDSYLAQVITGHAPHVEDPAATLSPDQVGLIEQWIRDGALPGDVRGDFTLPLPENGYQILIPPFDVPRGTEIQNNYYFRLNNAQSLWVNRIEFFSPPGIDHWNFFSWESGAAPPERENGDYDDKFALVSFRDWSLRASNQTERLDWRLPTGVAMQLAPRQQTLSQIHYVNLGRSSAPVGGSASINLHTLETDPGNPPASLGALILQDKSIRIAPSTTAVADYGVTFTALNHDVPVRLAGVQGHFHMLGKSFEIRLWDGLNQEFDGSPAPGEFDRMGPENTIYLSDGFEVPPFLSFGDDGPEIPAGAGLIYRSTFVNSTEELFCFGAKAEFSEHSIAFVYFYPGPLSRSGFVYFPPQCLGQGCSVLCF